MEYSGYRRPTLCLRASGRGSHLRIPEIEGLNRTRALIFLTSEPDEVLNFLRLETDISKRPFESVEAIYEYVCGCHFFQSGKFVRSDLKPNNKKIIVQSIRRVA